MKCKLSKKCEFGNLCKDATRHDSLTVLGCSSFKAKEPMTNEEWLEQASTEEKAKLLSKLCNFIYNCGKKGSIPKYMYEEDFVQWLKEVHKGA